MGCSKEDKECAKDESPLHDPVLSEYWIDRNEVTVTEFEQCVKSEVCAVPKAKAPTCNYGVTGRDKFPMNCIEWKQAQAYCGWVLKALPTEAQWEKAARGLNSWIYPWGDAPPASCLLAIMYDAGMGGAGCGTGTTWPVGTMDTESPYGALDMAGNVWEWAYDWYDSAYYLSSPAIDPQGPADGTAKVVRGGGFDTDSAANMRTSKRGAIDPSLVLDNTGFRCAFTKLK
jgi:formylglycine-generating enzyme required for sulfatase activity